MTLAVAIERLNVWGDQFLRLAWPLFWQSSILIAGMFLVDFFLRRKLRPAVRYALWLVVLVKLILPPSFALPTGIGWWLRPREIVFSNPAPVSYVVTYGPNHVTAPVSTMSRPPAPAPPVRPSKGAWALVGTSSASFLLLVLMLARWRRLHYELRNRQPAPIWLEEIANHAGRRSGHRRRVKVTLTRASISPALCGLFRPVVILPTMLVERLTPSQLRAVLLHELIHLRNGDVWMNCIQSLLQILFWWHPFVWFANARIRRIREEVVDDAVRLVLAEEAEVYAPTLLEVAKLALVRPLATLGLVGILESRHALRQRVERLVNYPAPKRAGLTFGSVIGVLAFTSIAVPMGQAPPKTVRSTQNNSGPIHYTFDRNFLDYFGSNGVEAVNRAIADFNSISNLSRYNAALLQPPADAEPFNFHGSNLSSNAVINENTGEIVAEGSVQLDNGARIPLGDKLRGNVTNLQLAQAGSSTFNPSRNTHTSSGRNGVIEKLKAIRLNSVSFDNLPLSEVISYLQNEARKRDPEGKGINFIINANLEMAAPAIDPATGLPLPATQPEPVDLNGVTIRIVPSLNDVRMLDVLDAVVKVASKPIRYAIEEYGVSFRAGGPPMLFTRTIKVPPNVFAQGLESVVGVSVGNFQTGGQAGQQGNSSVTIPRVQAAPSGTGGPVGQGGAQGGGGISGVTRPTTAISQEAIRQFFANAGVDLTPPKSIFYNYGNSALLVHATKDELDTIENAIKAIPASSTQSSASLKEKIPADSLAAQTNQTKIPFLGDLPIVGKVFTRTLEVAKATSPLPVPDQAVQSPGTKLFTRIITLDKNFFAGVQRQSHQSPNASRAESQKAFLNILNDAGVRLGPAEAAAFDDRTGNLIVHATEENIEAIESKVLTLSFLPPQVIIKAQFVQTAKGNTPMFFSEAKGLKNQIPSDIPEKATPQADESGKNSLSDVLSDPQSRAFMRMLEKRSDTDLKNEAQVTTLSGRQAQIQIVDMKSIVKLNPQALIRPGVTSSNVLYSESVPVGLILDIVPIVADDGTGTSLDLTVRFSEFIGYDEPRKEDEVAVYVDGKEQSTQRPHPRMRVRTLHTVANISDTQTLMLGNPLDDMITYDDDGNPQRQPTALDQWPSKPNEASERDLLAFITATIVDPNGNPIHPVATPSTSRRIR